MVKQFLSQRGVNYEERDVSRNQTYARELVNNTGQMGVPVIEIIEGDNSSLIFGYDKQILEHKIFKPQ